MMKVYYTSMSLAMRRLLFYILVILFLIAAPLLVVYTAGYRYNFKQRRIVRTGAFFVETIPKDAVIFLNGDRRKERSPARITNLTPGQWEIRIAKEGYLNWSKTLKIESEKTTYVNGVVLFKDARPKDIASGTIIDFFIDAPRNILFTITSAGGLYEVRRSPLAPDGRADASVLLWRGTFKTAPLIKEWQKREERLLLGSGDAFYTISTASDTSPAREPANPPAPETIEDVIPTITFKDAENLIPLSRFGDFVVLRETKKNAIVVVDRRGGAIAAQMEGNRAVWRETEQPLLFTFSAHEVWQFDPRGREVTLLTRLLEDIEDVTPVSQGAAVLITLPDRVRALELDGRDRQNSWDLATFDTIKKTALATDGKTLFILGRHEGKEGVWELELQ